MTADTIARAASSLNENDLKRIVAAIHRTCWDEDPEELLQDAWLALIEAGEPPERARDPAAFLAGVVRRQVLEAIRSRKKQLVYASRRGQQIRFESIDRDRGGYTLGERLQANGGIAGAPESEWGVPVEMSDEEFRA